MKTFAAALLLLILAAGTVFADDDRRRAIEELNRGQANNQTLVNPPHWWEFWKDPIPAPVQIDTHGLDEATNTTPQLTYRDRK